MAFVSRNEIGQFDFSDCCIKEIGYDGNDLVFELEALIVLENNTQNSNYTKSYADVAKLTLKDCEVISMFVAGYKEYDANDCIVADIPDKPIAEDAYMDTIGSMKDSYLYRFIKVSEDDGYSYDFEVEQSGPDELVDLRSDTYVVRVKFSECVVKWDKYLNRVQQ